MTAAIVARGDYQISRLPHSKHPNGGLTSAQELGKKRGELNQRLSDYCHCSGRSSRLGALLPSSHDQLSAKHLAAAVPIDPDRDQYRLAGDHAGLAHPSR